MTLHKARDVLAGLVLPFPTLKGQVNWRGITETEEKDLTSLIRKAYSRKYYEDHGERARDYQREYNLVHKKKRPNAGGRRTFLSTREPYRDTYNTSDIMQAPVEKVALMLERICSGQRMFTM